MQGVADDRPLNMNFLTCDHDFAQVLNIQMAEGRFFSREYPSDVDAIVINKKAAEYFGVPEPVGKKLRIWWTKEIGVRKVLGARLPQIIWLLTGQFVKWVIIANLIAWPVGYWVMNRWLGTFAFRTGLPAAIFLVSGLAALGIAVVSVSSQVIKAALSNPAQSLKYE